MVFLIENPKDEKIGVEHVQGDTEYFKLNQVNKRNFICLFSRTPK
jgi:hypothetical protein